MLDGIRIEPIEGHAGANIRSLLDDPEALTGMLAMLAPIRHEKAFAFFDSLNGMGGRAIHKPWLRNDADGVFSGLKSAISSQPEWTVHGWLLTVPALGAEPAAVVVQTANSDESAENRTTVCCWLTAGRFLTQSIVDAEPFNQFLKRFRKPQRPSSAAQVLRGGREEPYCSQACYDQAGREIFAANQRGETAPCGFCQKPVTLEAGSGIGMIPFRKQHLHICRECEREADAFIADIDECCMCGKALPHKKSKTAKARSSPALDVQPAREHDQPTRGAMDRRQTKLGNLPPARLAPVVRDLALVVLCMVVPFFALLLANAPGPGSNPQNAAGSPDHAQGPFVNPRPVSHGSEYTVAAKLHAKFQAHPTSVHHVAFSPDGKALLTCDQKGPIRLWQVWSAQAAGQFEADTKEGFQCAALSPDGRRLLGGTYNTFELILWDVTTGKQLWKRKTRRGAHAIAFFPDGQRAVVSGEPALGVIDVESGSDLGEFEGAKGFQFALHFTPDGRLLSGGMDKIVRLWDAETRKELRRWSGSPAWVISADISPDNRYVIAGHQNADFSLWRFDADAPVTVLESPAGGLGSAVRFSADGQRVFLATSNSLRVLNPKTGAEISSLDLRSYEGWQNAFSPDARYLTLATHDGRVHTLELVGEGAGWRYQPTKPLPTQVRHRRFAELPRQVNAIAVSPDGKHAAYSVGFNDIPVRWWDVEKGVEAGRTDQVASYPHEIAISADGRLAAGADSLTIYVWEKESGKKIAEISARGYFPYAHALTFTPDGTQLIAAEKSKILVIDIAQGKTVQSFDHPSPSRRVGIAVSADGKRFLMGTSAGIWIHERETEWKAGQPFVGAARGSTNELNAINNVVALSADGKLAASTACWHDSAKDPDGVIQIWDVESGKRKSELKGHLGGVNSLAFSLDSRYLISAGEDGSARLWDIAALEPKEVGRVGFLPIGRTGRAIFLPDSKRALIIHAQGTSTWDLPGAK